MSLAPSLGTPVQQWLTPPGRVSGGSPKWVHVKLAFTSNPTASLTSEKYTGIPLVWLCHCTVTGTRDGCQLQTAPNSSANLPACLRRQCRQEFWLFVVLCSLYWSTLVSHPKCDRNPSWFSDTLSCRTLYLVAAVQVVMVEIGPVLLNLLPH